MRLKLLGAAATSTIAALFCMPGQTAWAEDCIVKNGAGDGSSENRAGAFSDGDDDALACGTNARAGNQSIAVGFHAAALWDTTTDTKVGGTGAVAIGFYAQAGDEAIAIGKQARANFSDGKPEFLGLGSVAIGSGASAQKERSLAIGASAIASADSAVALGREAKAFATGATSLGHLAQANSTDSLALGKGSGATGTGAVALGSGSTINADYTVSVGSASIKRKIVNVADGTLSADSTDVVTGSQLFATNQNVAANEDELTFFHVNSTEFSQPALAGGTSSIAIGRDAQTMAGASSAIAIGTLSRANNEHGVALGTAANVSADNGIAIGRITYSGAADAAAIGFGSVATEANTISVGRAMGVDNPTTLPVDESSSELLRRIVNVADPINASDAATKGYVDTATEGLEFFAATGSRGDAFIDPAADDSVAIGTDARITATAETGIAIGDRTRVTAFRGVAIGKEAEANATDSLALGTQAAANSVLGIAIGRNTATTADQGVAIGVGSVASEADTISVGRAFGVDNPTTTGDESGSELLRRIVNVADGTLSADSTDVVTGGQLFATNQSVAANANELTFFHVNSTVFSEPALAEGVTSIAIGRDAHALAGATSAIAIGRQSRADGEYAVATGTNSSAIGENSEANSLNTTALGAYAKALASNAMAIGSGAEATFANSVAFGAGVQTLAANQFMFGHATNIYTMPGLTSQESRDAQSGSLAFVTVDANGNLATDGGATAAALQDSIDMNVALLDAQIDQNATDISGLETSLDAQDTRLLAVETSVGTNITALTERQKEIEHNARQIDINAADIALINAGVSGDGSRFVELEDNVEVQAERLSVVETNVTNNTTAITALTSTVNINQQRIAHSEQSIADNAAAISVMQTNLEQLELNVDAVAIQLARTREEIDENTAGIAIANALSGSTWLQSNEKVAFSANIGYYDGSTAIAFSGATRLNKHISANVALGLVPSRGDVGARAGVRVGW